MSVLADLRGLEKSEFWSFMDCRNRLHPFDAQGNRLSYADLRGNIDGLIDDSYRSLAGELREVGGYTKDTTPYSEFLWAAFLRRRIDVKDIEIDFEGVIAKSLASPITRWQLIYLPGAARNSPRRNESCIAYSVPTLSAEGASWPGGPRPPVQAAIALIDEVRREFEANCRHAILGPNIENNPEPSRPPGNP